ncbi:MAG: L-lactate dehydrogenase [Candidatus Gracilibacteria bacterium]
MKKSSSPSKLVIVGAGRVGTSLAYATMIRNIVSEIVLIDIDKKKVKGECMDLNHGVAFVETVRVSAGDYADCRNADYIVITAGASQQKGETRLALMKKNVKMLKNILPKILKYNRTAKFILVSNPVDILTYVALKISGLPRNQVFGSGTTLDTSRFRYLLGEEFGVSPDSIDAFIIGEHGDSEVAVFSQAQLGGTPLEKVKGYSEKKMMEIYKHTKNAAYEVIKYKGSTHYAIGLVTTDILQAMELNQHKVFPLSVMLKGEFGLKDVVLSLPCVVGAGGVERVMEMSLSGKETVGFKASAKKMMEIIKGGKFLK